MIVTDTEISPTLEAGAGEGGNNMPIIIDSIGGQHERAWKSEIAPTIKATHYKSPPQPLHCLNIIGIIADHPTPKISTGEIAFTQNSRDYKGVMIVVVSKNNGTADGKQPSREL